MRAEEFVADAVSAPETSIFDLSHDVKMSFNMGNLVPCLTQDCIPGDKFRIKPENLIRLAPMISPVMHKMTLTTHFFFVPNRILWDQWDNWIFGNVEVLHPYITMEEEADYTKSIGDYLGFPTKVSPNMKINPMPLAAYYKIYDDYYRDQNLQSELWTPLVAGDNNSIYSIGDDLAFRAWQHDYFTSCLPFAQKGDAAQIPLVSAQNIPVELTTGNTGWIVRRSDNTSPSTGDIAANVGDALVDSTGFNIKLDPNSTLSVDVDAYASTINSLRRSFALQAWLERNARGGTRSIEGLKAHFNVRSSDARLQRAEYIGGMKQNIVISEVLTTANSQIGEASNVVGDMYGHGISVSGGDTVTWFCEEHGWILGIMSLLPDTGYYQGLERKFTKLEVLDYAWPSFAHIGEQEVLNKEVYALQVDEEAANGTFGYIPRYSEYKFNSNRIAGEFRTNLDYWHMARRFGGIPALNAAFIKSNPTTRIFAITDTNVDHIYAHIYYSMTASRKLPKFGTPMLIG